MDREAFYIDDHAVLYGYLAQNADAICGTDGIEAITRGIVNYGRERGLRGAMRCHADGRELTGRNYMLYGEWADAKGWSKSVVAQTQPYMRTNMTVCGWCESWKKYDLTKYGALYCDWIDNSLIVGFNPELRLEMGTVISHGGEVCVFNWLDCAFEDEADLEAFNRERAEMIPRVTKDFLYHCGHLFSTFRRLLLLELGLIQTNKILDAALAEYGKSFGFEKVQAVTEEARQDFLHVE